MGDRSWPSCSSRLSSWHRLCIAGGTYGLEAAVRKARLLTAAPGLLRVRRASIQEPIPVSTASPPPLALSADLVAAAGRSKAWPFEEAQKVVERLKRRTAPAREVIFETGYGPSGLPHIGTFGEVARTTMVRTAFRLHHRGHGADPARLLLRRHGRAPQGARQRAQPGDDAGLSQPAADRGAGSVLERVSELRRRQQCAPARLPRPLRLRLRIRQRHRDLQGRALRRDAAEDAGSL